VWSETNAAIWFNKKGLTPHSTGYTHSLNHDTDNILTLYFNGKILKRVTLVRTNMSSLKMVHMA
jgi:hypothetical protein